jgi:hypothetical protein
MLLHCGAPGINGCEDQELKSLSNLEQNQDCGPVLGTEVCVALATLTPYLGLTCFLSHVFVVRGESTSHQSKRCPSPINSGWGPGGASFPALCCLRTKPKSAGGKGSRWRASPDVRHRGFHNSRNWFPPSQMSWAWQGLWSPLFKPLSRFSAQSSMELVGERGLDKINQNVPTICKEHIGLEWSCCLAWGLTKTLTHPSSAESQAATETVRSKVTGTLRSWRA